MRAAWWGPSVRARVWPCWTVLMWLGSMSMGMPLRQRMDRARMGTSCTPSIMVNQIASSM